MNKQQTKKVTEEVTKIDKLGINALSDYVGKLYLAKVDLDEMVFKLILKACDVQGAKLMERTDMSSMVVLSDLPQLD